MVSKNLVFIILLAVTIGLFSEGDTRYDSNLNLPFNEKAGDVDPQTGDISIPVTDLSLPGRGMDFSYGRVWNIKQASVFNMIYDNGNKLDSNTIEKRSRIGVGWRSSVPYINENINGDYTTKSLFFGGSIYQIDTANLNIDNGEVSNLKGYDLLDLIIFYDQSLKYENVGLLKIDALTNKYADLVISKDRNSHYGLVLKDNSKYYFDIDGNLMMQQDKTGLNKIWYFYDATGRLKLVLDTIGREVEFSYNVDGNLSQLSWEVSYGSIDGENRTWIEGEKRSVLYNYEKAETMYPGFDWNGYRNSVKDYRDPYILKSVQNPYDQVKNVVGKENETETKYDYEAAITSFTFDKVLNDKENLNLLINGIYTGYSNINGEEKFVNKKNIAYSLPVHGKQKKNFYNGHIYVAKVSKVSYRDKDNTRDLMPVEYSYLEPEDTGFDNTYKTVIETGGLKNSYIYTANSNISQNNVLHSITTEADGFNQVKLFEYNLFRTKTKDIVKRDGLVVYSESYRYDKKGNLKWMLDRSGLETLITYDDKHSIPKNIEKRVKVDGVLTSYMTENEIDDLGRVEKQRIFLVNDPGKFLESTTVYDEVTGNIKEQIDFNGNKSFIEYDTLYNTFPVKNYSYVDIPVWNNGIENDWVNDPDIQKHNIEIQNIRKYNSDGTVWIEVDNEGFAIEHYYNVMGQEIRTVNPDEGDYQTTNLEVQSELDKFLPTREGNPGVSMEVYFQDCLIKTYADIDKASGSKKITGVLTDGLGHTISEIEYGPNSDEYKSEMTYDIYGRMIALTDADASEDFNISKNTSDGTTFKKHDKTWLIMYDNLNRQIQVVYPVTDRSKGPGIKRIMYDDFNNTITTIDPEKRVSVQTMDWAGNLTSLLLKGDYNTSSNDYQEYKYEYDELGRKTLFIDPKDIETAYIYNERDLLIEQRFLSDKANVEAKSDFMEYDAMGQLVKKTDRKGQVSTFVYDSLGRNIELNNYKSDGSLYNTVKTAFDNRGNAVRIDNQNLIEFYQYDFANRATTLNRKLKDNLSDIRSSVASVWGGDPSTQTFSFSYEYNDAGLVTKMVYPDGSEHTFDYDNQLARLQGISEKTIGELTSTGFVTGLQYTKSGVVTDMTYNNGVTQHWDFDNRKRISHISINDNTNKVLEDLNYVLNKNGDILSINENEYEYDGFNRIIGAKTLLPASSNDPSKLVKESFGTYKDNAPIIIDGKSREYNPLADLNEPAPDNRINGLDHIKASFIELGSLYDIESFEYDKNGNRTKLSQNGDIYTYKYGARNRLEQVFLKKENENSAKEFITYKYDDNGNLAERIINRDEGPDTVLFEYDTLNRLIKTNESGNITNYFYDNAGNRFIKASSSGETTLYLRHGQIAVAMDIEIAKAGEEYKGKVNRYVLSGDLVAGRITKTVNNDDTTTTTKSYYHLDHLNSTKLVTDKDGTIEANYTYRAFGEQLNELQEKDAKYTYGGKELDTNTNLYYFNARFYDATIGRFINVDPIQDGTNWYIYCSNNPLNFIDPTGLEAIFPDGLSLSIGHPAQLGDYSLYYNMDSAQINHLIGSLIKDDEGSLARKFTKDSALSLIGVHLVGTIASTIYNNVGVIMDYKSEISESSSFYDFMSPYLGSLLNGTSSLNFEFNYSIKENKKGDFYVDNVSLNASIISNNEVKKTFYFSDPVRVSKSFNMGYINFIAGESTANRKIICTGFNEGLPNGELGDNQRQLITWPVQMNFGEYMAGNKIMSRTDPYEK